MTITELADRAPKPEQVLANWETLYSEFRKATPSSPIWYSLVDMAVGVLISERIDELKARARASMEEHHG